MHAILTYHSIDSSGSPISVSKEAFAGHVAWLASGRVRVLPLHELARDTDTSSDAVAIAFDDAFANFATEAWPLLKAHALPVTLFVVTQRVGTTNDWGGQPAEGIPTLPLLGWDELGRLHAEGVEMGGHTRTHPRLSTLGTGHTADEVVGCAHDLESRFGRIPRTFAYPYGDVTPVARRFAVDTFAWACTTEHRALVAKDPRDLLPRLDMFYFNRPKALNRFGSAAFRARVAARRAARSARAAAVAARRSTALAARRSTGR